MVVKGRFTGHNVMNAYNKVVVPLDGSPLAEVALPYAEEIAGKIGSEIVLLTVLSSEEPEEYQNQHNYSTSMVDTTRRQVEKYLKDDGKKSIKIAAATRVGDPASPTLSRFILISFIFHLSITG